MDYFASASKARVQITHKEARSISKMYKELSKEIADEAKSLKGKENVSSVLRSKYLKDLQRQIDEELKRIGNEQDASIRAGMKQAAESVVAANEKMLIKFGLNVKGAYSFLPKDIVKEVASGNLYKGRWDLSSAIWKNLKKNMDDINMIIAKGIAAQKSTYEIAKDLEKYVNPAARKDWKWSKVYPGTARVIDYNAQRLARTMISHAYQESFVRTTRNNPFVTEYRWLASGGDRMCEICAERDGKLFHKDELPLDHPNGMCTFEAVIPDSYEEIANRLADWVNGTNDPELDNFAKDLGYFFPVSVKGKVLKN